MVKEKSGNFIFSTISKSYFTDGILSARLVIALFDFIGLDMDGVLPLLYCRRTSFRPMLVVLSIDPKRFAGFYSFDRVRTQFDIKM